VHGRHLGPKVRQRAHNPPLRHTRTGGTPHDWVLHTNFSHLCSIRDPGMWGTSLWYLYMSTYRMTWCPTLAAADNGVCLTVGSSVYVGRHGPFSEEDFAEAEGGADRWVRKGRAGGGGLLEATIIPIMIMRMLMVMMMIRMRMMRMYDRPACVLILRSWLLRGGYPRRWTVLVNDVERHVPEVADLLASFRFAPNWRLDDM
jgi:hypothetical protein